MKATDRLVENAEYLIATGEWPERMAARLGYKNLRSLNRALLRIGRSDLTRQIRMLDRTSIEFQQAHYTPMDEVVRGDQKRYRTRKKEEAAA